MRRAIGHHQREACVRLLLDRGGGGAANCQLPTAPRTGGMCISEQGPACLRGRDIVLGSSFACGTCFGYSHGLMMGLWSSVPLPALEVLLCCCYATVVLLGTRESDRDVSGDPPHKRKMRPAQEVANAMSMAIPAWLAYRFYAEHLPLVEGWYMWAAMWGEWVHFPVSACYHIKCAIEPGMDHIENPWRRMDMCFIHFACFAYAYALSGSPVYTAAAAVVNLFGCYQLWLPGRNKPVRNWRNLGLGILGYLFPIAYRADWGHLGAAFGGLACTVGVFVGYPFGGWR